MRAAVLIAVGLTAMLLQNHPEYSIRSTALRLDLALNPLEHFYDAFSGVTQWVSPHDFLVIGVVAFVLGGCTRSRRSGSRTARSGPSC